MYENGNLPVGVSCFDYMQFLTVNIIDRHSRLPLEKESKDKDRVVLSK